MKQILHLLVNLLFLFALCGCFEGIEAPVIIAPVKTSGAMLVSHGNYLYFIGGILEDGSASPKTYVALIDQASEGDLQWTETTPMPYARAHGAAVAVGNMLYVIGGSDGTGPVATIQYTSISKNDGTLGFGTTSRFWETDQNTLPYGLSHMSHILHDGRVFLIGGKKEGGLSDVIIHARLWQKGTIGMWYEGTQKLSSPRFRTGSALWFDDDDNPHLVVAGGIDSMGRVLNEVTAYPINSYGKLEAALSVASIPKALDSPILVSNLSGLLIGGGFASDAKPSSTAYRCDSLSGTWTVVDQEISAQGPSFGRGARSIWYLVQGQGEIAGIASLKINDYRPAVPVIGPGSGTVQYNTGVSSKSEAGTNILFSRDGGLWQDIASLGKITVDQVVSFKASSLMGNIDSPAIVRDYRVQALGFLVHISGSTGLHNSADDFQTIHMTDDIDDGASTGRSSVRVKFQVLRPTDIAIYLKDGSSDPGTYTAHVTLSLFEEDLLAPVLDSAGNPILDLLLTPSQPVEASLQRGTYYYTFEDAQGKTGRSFGLSVCARE